MKHILILLISILWMSICHPVLAEDISSINPDILADTDSDMASVSICRRGLDATLRLLADNDNLFSGKKSTHAHLPGRNTRNELLIAWSRIRDYYTAIDLIAHRHKDFMKLESKELQGKAFHVFRACTYAGYRCALDFIAFVEENPALDSVLNDPSPAHRLAGGTYLEFKTKYLNVVQATVFAAIEAITGYYGPLNDEKAAAIIEEDRKRIWEAGFGEGPVMTVKNGMDIVEKSLQTAWFPFQKGISNWMGDTKVHRVGEYLITPNMIQKIKGRLEPGDILIERREWYMTNVGIPGFWTHAALYVGNPEERRQYFQDTGTHRWVRGKGAADFEELLQQAWPKAYQRSMLTGEEGKSPSIIEAIAQGVSFTTLEKSASCDSLAVLRPRLSKTLKARAVYLAFGYSGRPYDYDFNFTTDSSLVCSELIYKAYAPDKDHPGITFPLEKMMGRILTPPNAFAKMFHDEIEKPGRQLDLVVFIDGYEKDRIAMESDITAFLESWRRPKWHIMIQPSLSKQ